MPGTRRDPNTLRATPLGKALADELGTKLATTRPVLKVAEADLIGALLYAASRSPLEAIKANVSAYQDFELDHADELAAAQVVGSFLVHFGRYTTGRLW